MPSVKGAAKVVVELVLVLVVLLMLLLLPLGEGWVDDAT
jgi:hypothetical protein